MEKITYGKSATSRVAAVLRMINAKFNRLSFSVVEGKAEDAKKVWDEIAYSKTSNVPQKEAELLNAAKQNTHPLFFLKMPYFIEHIDKSDFFKKGIEATIPQELINYLWANDINALEEIGENAPAVKEVQAPKKKVAVAKPAKTIKAKPKATAKKAAPKKKTVTKEKVYEYKEVKSNPDNTAKAKAAKAKLKSPKK